MTYYVPDRTTRSNPSTVTEESAYTILRTFFASFGLEFDAELESVINNAMLAGYGPDQMDLIMPDLQNTQAFKKRFPGFQQRISNGYNAISLGDYLRLEDEYHRTLQHFGLPVGFYDDPSDFGNFIANNIAPAEIESRARLAFNAAQQVDPTMRRLMSEFYGLTTGDVAAYFLDPNRALPLAERQYQSAGIAAAAARNGFSVSSMSRYEDLLDKGVTAEQAQSGYGTVRALRDSVGRTAGVYGERYDQTDAENDVFFNNSEKRRRIIAQEAATFGGSSSGTAGSTGSAKRQSY